MERRAALASGLLTALAVAGLSLALLRASADRGAGPEPSLPVHEHRSSYAELLARVNGHIEFARAKLTTGPDDWMELEALADALTERAELTGSFVDYAAAEAELARAFAMAPAGSGPWLAQARLHATLHRFDRVEACLQAQERQVVIKPSTRLEILALRAEVAFQRGDYAGALQQFREACARDPSAGPLASLALCRASLGEFEEAERGLSAAIDGLGRSPAARMRAWLYLQLGLLDLERGRYPEALAHYADAERWLSGWWLVREHRAEVLALTGKLDEAAAIYREVALETGSPELMDALANAEERLGDGAECASWRERARESHEQRLALLPEAAAGHALESYLEHGDPVRTVSLAERNRDLRPGAEAHVLLASAYLRAGRQEDAVAAMEVALATPFQNTQLFRVGAQVMDAAGDPQRAALLLARARKINPLIEAPPSGE